LPFEVSLRTFVGSLKAEAFGATFGISFVQPVSSLLTAVTLAAYDIFLEVKNNICVLLEW
jgi:hypothetical protein